MLGRVATGPRAGHRVMRLGTDPGAAAVTTGRPRHAHLEASTCTPTPSVPAGAQRLDNLCRYVLGPPVAQDAMELTPDPGVSRLRRPPAPGGEGRAAGGDREDPYAPRSAGRAAAPRASDIG